MTSATVTATASMKTSAASVKASTEARLSAHGVASGHAAMIKATERAGARACLAMSCESTLRCRMTSESITVSIATMESISTMKSAGVIEVSVCAIGVVVAIYKRSAVRDVDVTVVNDAVVMPVRSPAMPSPSKPAKETDWITYSEQNSRCGNK